MTKAITARRMPALRSRHFGIVLNAVEAMSAATPLRWRCYHRTEGSDIEAWVPAKDGLEMIAWARQAEGISARANAELIVQAVNAYEKFRPLIAELTAALEVCMESGKLAWAAEQEADIVCRKARRVLEG